jgi:hypothetical protein
MVGQDDRIQRPNFLPHRLQRQNRRAIADMALDNGGLNRQNGHARHRGQSKNKRYCKRL